METLLNSFTQEMLKARRQKLRKYLEDEHNQILKKIDDHMNSVLRIKKTKFNCDIYQEMSEAFNLFKVSCQNIINTYFPLLMDPDFLALQSEQQLIDKVSSLKTIIDRNASTLLKKITRAKEEETKQKKIKKNFRRKGKNCKIPIESTSIMQKWLLENFRDPYPSPSKKLEMARASKLSVGQVSNWFINARERVIKKLLRKDPKQYQKPMKSQISDQSS